MQCSVLVFPAGTEIGLEIYRCLKDKKGIELLGASSVKDMASLNYDEVYELPFLLDERIEQEVIDLVDRVKPDFLVPAHDDAVTLFSEMEEEGLLGHTRVLGSPAETCRVVRSKLETYRLLRDAVEVPVLIQEEYELEQKGLDFPLFAKPDKGQGSRGATIIHGLPELRLALNRGDVVSEYLSGEEFTVDCYNGRGGELKFCGPRRRDMRSNGISVKTSLVGVEEFEPIAEAIASVLNLTGPWFFQAKRRGNSELVLLEVAARIGGSSGIWRFNGVNFLLAALYEWNGAVVSFQSNRGISSTLRCLSEHRLKLPLPNRIFVDLDDTLVLSGGVVNWSLIGVLGSLNAKGASLFVLTRHGARHGESAMEFLEGLGFPMIMFSAVYDLREEELKSEYVEQCDIFIDDSYFERREVEEKTGALCFDVNEFIGCYR